MRGRMIWPAYMPRYLKVVADTRLLQSCCWMLRHDPSAFDNCAMGDELKQFLKNNMTG